MTQKIRLRVPNLVEPESNRVFNSLATFLLNGQASQWLGPNPEKLKQKALAYRQVGNLAVNRNPRFYLPSMITRPKTGLEKTGLEIESWFYFGQTIVQQRTPEA